MNLRALVAEQQRPTKGRRVAVAEVLADGQLHTLSDLASKTGYDAASVSAELREMRRRGGVNVQKEVVLRHERHVVYGYRRADGPAVVRRSLARSAPAMLRRVRGYLEGFRKLDADGDRLLADVRELLSLERNGKESQ